ncbi:probable serine/threonine-protein kinase mps1 isoform X2 [Neltuma alba]|uniref:probable serine/threonine-protein kinase mps1 isoform X2 n=1 Tax=Neltuma alba TaxID=207710 RepID=UPI0010A46534|nr:probable serine/threonine-protein kinase mps1 isoform X2 [Prosopis alba]
MDGKANLPVSPPTAKNLIRPINPDTTSSSSSSLSSSSPPDFLRHVQAAFKRHRPLGTVQSNIRPRRMMVPQREVSRNSTLKVGANLDNKKSQEISLSKVQSEMESSAHGNSTTSMIREGQEDVLVTPPSVSGSCNNALDQVCNSFNAQECHLNEMTNCKDKIAMHSLPVESQNVDGQKKVQFLVGNNTTAQEMEWASSTQPEESNLFNQDPKHQSALQAESELTLRSEGGLNSQLAKRTTAIQDHLQQFRNFLSQPATQSSVVGPSCATTTSVHSSSAPMLNSTTHYSYSHVDSGSHLAAEPLRENNVNSHLITQGVVKSSSTYLKETNKMLAGQAAVAPSSAANAGLPSKDGDLCEEQQGGMLKESNVSKTTCDDKPSKRKESADVTNIQPQAPTSRTSFSDVKLDSSKSEKQEKAGSSKSTSGTRKRGYDPDLFFKVNGKLYQRLGKIGSGGSSEVHKVISSDCTIYALKKIKLKGRDYATAYGFCQEIEYLNRLKGKNNIIQLIDYEVTDKALLDEVLRGSLTSKDSRVKDDGYIYMVLEYGEIDLAHMLSQKWKELDGYNQTIDENWLRFYWQQILQAVNTIHEERIVHSDLKPANFLLVKGSLKLIDFGIAKAIMSDTTNIQRDSQVGTLSYMSPEAFMCNESDANGNIIKCGRPSDIWSLGCILYQMVYGRTPFSEYKTFWAKFKVITDPNHEITYEPVSNPWLLDLMKRCLAWDRNERWRIPQLLQHPFLVPPTPPQPSPFQDQSFKLLQFIAETCIDDPEASKLCCELQQVVGDPLKLITPHSLSSRDHQCKLLSQLSELCLQLHERLKSSDREAR